LWPSTSNHIPIVLVPGSPQSISKMPHNISDLESEDLDDVPFDVDDIDPYKVLEIERIADQKQIRKAYYAAAVKHHPDKVEESGKDAATQQFQKIQFAYTILSDEQRKVKYDRTGSTKEATELDDEDFSWKDFFDGLNEKVNEDAINQFKKEYKTSDEEKDDLLAAYTKFKGRMDDIYEHIMLSNALDDDERFRAIIDQAIKDEEVPPFKAYTQETPTSRKKRAKKAGKEAEEAEAYAKELNLPASFFGGTDEKPKDTKGIKKQKKDDSLKTMIQNRQNQRQQTFFSALEAKYLPTKADRKLGKKRAREEEVFGMTPSYLRLTDR
jgi:DnaJ family protein C protein 9